MAKVFVISCILFCSFVFTSAATQAKGAVNKPTENEMYDPEMNCTKKVKLTPEQQKKLDQIYNKIHHDYSDLIKVYSEAGGLTPPQEKLRHVMLNNYVKTFYKRNYRWCSEHESDEWEEEWYNNDND
jgi:hypothetical protein